MSRKKLKGKGAIAFKIFMLLLVSMEMEFPLGSLAFSTSCLDGATNNVRLCLCFFQVLFDIVVFIMIQILKKKIMKNIFTCSS